MSALSFGLMLSIPAAIWTMQAAIGMHRAMYRQNRRDMPVLFGRDNAIRVWLSF
ncbi:hypothetical protein [Mesorhizobium sp. M0859]|uniref:hypothetical protein n=1 Tax=Mesorhizobium sp. M0859 TaxID=2957014 RepID=UPI00333DC0F7